MIDSKLYKKIIENIPICCVDIILITKNKKILLAKRKQEPEKNKWWFIGGRINFGEEIVDAAVRKTFEESKISIEKDKLKFVGVFSTIFGSSAFNCPTHTINITYKYTLSDFVAIPNYTIEKISAFTKNNIVKNRNEFPDYIVDIIKNKI